MASNTGAPVTITSTLDLADIQRRLVDAEVKILNKHRSNIVTCIRDGWVGWLYTGRAIGAPRLVSHDAWTSTVASTQSEATVTITNDATTKKGVKYAGYIHRAGTKKLEWEKVAAEVETKFVPLFIADITAEILNNILVPQRPRVVRGGMSTRGTARNIGRTVP